MNAPLTAEEVTPVANARVWGELTKQFNRLYASVGADFEPQQYGDNPESRFGDDLLIDVDGLDGFSWSAGGRLGYEVSPGYRVFGDVRLISAGIRNLRIPIRKAFRDWSGHRSRSPG